MEKKYCKDCGYFYQHYALDDRKIFRVFCGHCTLSTARRKQPHTIACDGFVPALPDENAFATKEYLSKTLLEYMMKLELLPEIEKQTET